MEFHPGRSLHIHNILCKNVIVSVFVVMLMLPSILVNISLSPLSHSPPKLSLIFPKYLSMASTRLGSEHLSMKWASSPNGVSAQNVHVRCDLGFTRSEHEDCYGMSTENMIILGNFYTPKFLVSYKKNTCMHCEKNRFSE